MLRFREHEKRGAYITIFVVKQEIGLNNRLAENRIGRKEFAISVVAQLARLPSTKISTRAAGMKQAQPYVY